MGLFQDVTAEYAKHRSASLCVGRTELARLHASGLAIADTETTGLKAGANGLLEPAVIRAMTVGEMKAYNREAKARGLPGDQRIPIPRGYADSAIRLIALQHFVLPNRPMIHDRDDGMKLPSGSYTSDLQQAYEYDTSAYALGVTHTELEREKGYGPIQAMKVGGETVKALPSFVPLMQSFLLFTGKSQVGPKNGVAYFNAPFDIPFLRELIVDVMAYESAKKNEHRDHTRAVHRGVGALDVDYNAETTTPTQRAKIVAHIKKRLLESSIAQQQLAEYFAPARWHCVLQAFRAAHPELGGHTLDTLMKTTGLAEGERGAHSAIEDVVLTARGMLHLLAEGKLGQDALPAMAELPAVILRRSHGDLATSHAAKNGRDVVIDFPKRNTPYAKAVEDWIRSFNRAKPADARQPELSPKGKKWFSTFHEDAQGFHIVASGAEKRPLFLSFVKHLGVASQLLDGRYPWITALEANDKPGTFVDVTIDGQCLHDVPWNILRRNVEYIDQQPAGERVEMLKFLRDIEVSSDALGGVLLREDNGRRYFRLYGHVRQHGTVDIPWPKEVPLAVARELVLKHLEETTRLGLVPHASRAQLTDNADDAEDTDPLEEDAKRPDGLKPFSSTTFDFLKAGDAAAHIHREITPAMFQLFKAAMPRSDRYSNFSRTIDTVKFGKHYRIAVGNVRRGDKTYITLDGDPQAFDAYVARRKPDATYEAMAEKPTNILTDAGWLLDRLQKIPGVGMDGVEVTARNRIIVHQPLGIGTDALALMHAAQVPYRAEEKELRFSAGALMQDAFTYSLAISRTLKNDAHHKLMGADSIIPSITKGLKDKSSKDENHKLLGHVKWDPLLGLQLHYKAHGGRPSEITRIPPDKMVERSLPIGRRRVQRVFARLAYLPKKLESLDHEVRWEVTLTPLEQALLMHALAEAGATVEWRRNAQGEACVVISEKQLAMRGNPIYLAMQTMSEQLAKLTESTGVPEWYFSAQPELNGDIITLKLPEDRSGQFRTSAVPVYESIQVFLQRLRADTSGISLDKNLKRIMGDRGGSGSSVIKNLDYTLRRDPEAKLRNILDMVEYEAPKLMALHSHARGLASAITPSTVASEDDKSRRTLALNQLLMTDRHSIRQLIAACDAMADKEPEHAAQWMALRDKATDTTDRMARAIHEADRLKEALNTGASTIANDGAQWRSSLIGATAHARLDTLEIIYCEQVRTHTPGLVDRYLARHTAMLKQFGMREGDGKRDALLATYRQHAAQRLAVLHALERDPQHKQALAQAATQALADAYGLAPAISADFMKLYETIVDPSKNREECKRAGEALMRDIPGFGAKDYWVPMCLFGKATKEDVLAAQRAELVPVVDKKIKSAYHEVGIAHLYLAAQMQAELEKLTKYATASTKNIGKLRQRSMVLETGIQHHKAEMRRCYASGGYNAETAEIQLRAQTRAAIKSRPKFQKILAEKKVFLSLKNERATLLEYTPEQQERILRACIAEEGGQLRFEEFLYARAMHKITLDADLQAISINDPTFEVVRDQRNKTAILKAKDRMVAELDDLGKIQSHARRDIEALGVFLQHEAVKLELHLEAMPLNLKQMDLPEFQGLEKNNIPELRAGAETLDRQALRQAKAAYQPGAAPTKYEYRTRSIQRSLSALLGVTAEEAKNLVPVPEVHTPRTNMMHTDYFLLDTSAVIGYFDTLRHHVPRPDGIREPKPDLVRYHGQLLHRLEVLAQPENHGYMPLRIPDYVFYELSGLMPPMLQQATKRFATIEARYASRIEKAQGGRREQALQEKARAYQGEIDNLVDWSIRLDRRRPLDEKSTIGDRVEELNQLLTLFAYHPEIVLPTRVGKEYFQNARIESAVVAGIGTTGRVADEKHYRTELVDLQQAVASHTQPLPQLAHYTLSFDDLLNTPGLNFQTDDLRIHWGQMYFMGLIDEHQYRNFMRNMSGAKEANAQGHDNNSRFVTYGSLINRTKETGLTGSGLVRAVKMASDAMALDGAKTEAISRHNLTLGELQRYVPELQVRHAIGPAKLTMEQGVFGGLLPGASIKRNRVGEVHEINTNDAEVESLRLMAQTLGYAPPEINADDKDRYEGLRNALKHQGFFERTLTLEDCVRTRQALSQAGIACHRLDVLLEHMPQQLSAKPATMIVQKNGDGSIVSTAPMERIFTQALVHGVLSSAQFVALLAKLEPSSLNVTQAPRASIKAGGLILQFQLKPSATNIRSLSADKLAACIEPKSCWLIIPDQSAPHFERRQRFDDLVAMGCSARRSGANFSEGQALLDRLLVNQFHTDEFAPKKKLSAAHTVFTELFGAVEGDVLFFQLMKDFESRQERQFQTGDHVAATRKPADCTFAANHRNRLIDRRNKGEAALVEAAHTLQVEKQDAQLWVIGNDSDIVSLEQYRWLAPEIETDNNKRHKSRDPVMLGAQCETPGVRLRPPVAAQHSRLAPARGKALEGDERVHNVPTRDWLDYQGRLNAVSPVAGRDANDFTHRYGKGSTPFRERFA